MFNPVPTNSGRGDTQIWWLVSVQFELSLIWHVCILKHYLEKDKDTEPMATLLCINICLGVCTLNLQGTYHNHNWKWCWPHGHRFHPALLTFHREVLTKPVLNSGQSNNLVKNRKEQQVILKPLKLQISDLKMLHN